MIKKVTKEIYQIENLTLGVNPTTISQVIDSFATEKAVETRSIEINLSPEHHKVSLGRAIKLSNAAGLSFDIDEDEVKRIINDIIKILQNPILTAKYLENLDAEIGAEMAEAKIKFSNADLPQYLIVGKGHFTAGPPPENYEFRHKGRTLDRVLLKREMAHGINVEGFVAKFVGLIPSEDADKFVASGHIFAEDEQVDNMLFHGKYSHRLVFEIIREAVEQGDLDFTLFSEKNLTQKQLLELFINVRLKVSGASLWAITLDNLMDSAFNESVGKPRNSFQLSYAELFNQENYSYSSRSPYTVKSMVTCFGQDLGLPNLQHYLLDSHWKQTMKMVDLVLEKDVESKLKGSKSDTYTNCMKFLSCDGFSIGFIMMAPFSISPVQASSLDKYQPFTAESHPNIKKKITEAKSVNDDIFRDVDSEDEEEIKPSNSFKTNNSAETVFTKFLNIISGNTHS